MPRPSHPSWLDYSNYVRLQYSNIIQSSKT
jgi:hypothetical protein